MFNYLNAHIQTEIDKLTPKDIEEAKKINAILINSKYTLQDLIQTISSSAAAALDQPISEITPEEATRSFHQIAEINKAIIDLDYMQENLGSLLRKTGVTP